LADESKYVEKLTWPVLRQGLRKDGAVITDNGNFVMDVDFGTIVDPKGLAAKISPIPGVVEHGIFDNLDELYLARACVAEII
jgi:ribose 5-phosphate isomerase A